MVFIEVFFNFLGTVVLKKSAQTSAHAPRNIHDIFTKVLKIRLNNNEENDEYALTLNSTKEQL